jgi:hypothetical protein
MRKTGKNIDYKTNLVIDTYNNGFSHRSVQNCKAEFNSFDKKPKKEQN